MVWNTAIIAATAFLLASSPALAQSEDCTRTLIPATTKLVDNTLQKLSLAWSMSSDDYNEARKDASGSGVIYDVPVGADYKEFQKNVQKKAEELHLENFQMRALAYATSALSAENRYIFGMCEASKGGLYVASGKMGTDNYQISIYYKPAIDVFDIRGHVGGSSNIEATSLGFLSEKSLQRILDTWFGWSPFFHRKIRWLKQLSKLVFARLPIDALPPLSRIWRRVRPVRRRPDDKLCNQAELGLASICWSNGANRGYPRVWI